MRCVASLASIHPPGPRGLSLSHLGHGYFAYIVWSNVAGHHNGSLQCQRETLPTINKE
jgi:hypothetical protein